MTESAPNCFVLFIWTYFNLHMKLSSVVKALTREKMAKVEKNLYKLPNISTLLSYTVTLLRSNEYPHSSHSWDQY